MKSDPTAWTKKLTRHGISVDMLSHGHWRATLDTRSADYWPTTDRWRDLGTGQQGVGLASLTRHLRKKPKS